MLGVGIAGQEMFGHIGEIECRTLLARDGGEVVALSDDENIIFVAGRESPGLAARRSRAALVARGAVGSSTQPTLYFSIQRAMADCG